MAPDVFGPFSWFVHQSRGSSKFTAHLFWLLSWLSWQKGLPPLQPNDAPSKRQHVFAAKAEPESLRIFGLRFSFNLKASHQHRKYDFFQFPEFPCPLRNLSHQEISALLQLGSSHEQLVHGGRQSHTGHSQQLRMSGWQPHGRRYHSGITAHQVKGATVKPVLGSLTCAAARTFTYDTWAADKTTSNLRIWNSSRCLTHSGCHLCAAAHVNFLLHFKLSTCITFSLCYVFARQAYLQNPSLRTNYFCVSKTFARTSVSTLGFHRGAVLETGSANHSSFHWDAMCLAPNFCVCWLDAIFNR